MKTKIKRISKRSFSALMAFLMMLTTLMVGTITSVNADSSATVYYGIDPFVLDSNTISLNSNSYYNNSNHWNDLQGTSTGYYYNGFLIYSSSGHTYNYSGFTKFEFHYDGWNNKYTPFDSWTTDWDKLYLVYGNSSGAKLSTTYANTAKGWGKNDNYYLKNNFTATWSTGNPKMLTDSSDDTIKYYDFYGKKTDFSSDNYQFRFRFYKDGDNSGDIVPNSSGTDASSATNNINRSNNTYKDYYWKYDLSSVMNSTDYYRLRVTFDTDANNGKGSVQAQATAMTNMNPTFSTTTFNVEDTYNLTSLVRVTSNSNVGTVSYSSYKYYDTAWHDISDATSWNPANTNITKLKVTATDGGIVTTNGETKNAKNSRSETYETSITTRNAVHSVTVGSHSNGTLYVGESSSSVTSSSLSVREGNTYYIKATPDDGYKLTSLTAGGESVIGNNSNATTAVTVSRTMSTSDETVTAVFSPRSYTVSCGGSNVNYTTNPTSGTYGQTVNFTVTGSDSNYEISGAPTATYTDSNSVQHEITLVDDGNGSYHFTQPAGNVTIKTNAVLAPQEITLDLGDHVTFVSATVGGVSYTPDENNKFKVAQGSSLIVTVSYDDGYEYNTSTGGFTAGGTDNVTFTNTISAPVTLGVTAKPKKYNVSFNYDTSKYTITVGGNSVSSGTVAASYTESFTFTVTPTADYHIVSVIKDSSTTLTPANSTYSFTMPKANVSINITAAETLYSITRTAGVGGSVVTTPLSAGNVTPVQLGTATPDPGYSFVNWTVESGTGTVENSTNASQATIKASAPLTVKANFAPINYTITTANDSHGVISVSTSCSHSSAGNHVGETVTVSNTPNTDYAFDYFKVKNMSTNDETTYSSGNTFTMPAANVTVTGYFKEKTYTVTVQSENTAKGTVVEGSIQAGNLTWHDLPNASAQPGYSFKRWVVTSTSGTSELQNDTNHSTGKIKTNSACTVTAEFEEVLRTVSVVAQSQGSKPLGSVTPSSGQAGVVTSFQATATAKTGYTFKEWGGDNLTFSNTTTAADGSSSTTNIKASADNATATAKFKRKNIYLDVSNKWNASSYNHFAVYFFWNNDSNHQWVTMSLVDGESTVYMAEIPSAAVTAANYKVVFVALNNANNDWAYKAKQTEDQDICASGSELKNLFKLGNESNNKNTGTWSSDAYFPPVTHSVKLTVVDDNNNQTNTGVESITAKIGSENPVSYTNGNTLTVNVDDEVVFSVTYAVGYEYGSYKENNSETYTYSTASTTNNDNDTFHVSSVSSITKPDVFLTLTPQKKTYTINKATSPNGIPVGNSVSTSKNSGNYQDSVTITVNTTANYYLQSLSDGEDNIPFNKAQGGNGNSYTISYTMPARNVTITASFIMLFTTDFYVDMHDNTVSDSSDATKLKIAILNTDDTVKTNVVDDEQCFAITGNNDCPVIQQGTSTVYKATIKTPLTKNGNNYQDLRIGVTYNGRTYTNILDGMTSDTDPCVKSLVDSTPHEIWLEAANEESVSLSKTPVTNTAPIYYTDSTQTGRRIYVAKPIGWPNSDSAWDEIGIVQGGGAASTGNHMTWFGNDDDYYYYYSDIASNATDIRFDGWGTATNAPSNAQASTSEITDFGENNFFVLGKDGSTYTAEVAPSKLKRIYLAKPVSLTDSKWNNIGIYYWGSWGELYWKYGVHMNYAGKDASYKYYFVDVPNNVRNYQFQGWSDRYQPGQTPSANTSNVSDTNYNFFELNSDGSKAVKHDTGYADAADYSNYCSAVTLNKTQVDSENASTYVSIMPTVAKGTVSFSISSQTPEGVLSSVDENGNIFPAASGTAVIKVKVMGTVGALVTDETDKTAPDYREYNVTVTVKDPSKLDNFNIMSLSSRVSTINIPTVNSDHPGDITAITTYLTGVTNIPTNSRKGGYTGSAIVSIATGGASATVKYAAPNSGFEMSNGSNYGGIVISGTVTTTSRTSTSSGRRYGIKEWRINSNSTADQDMTDSIVSTVSGSQETAVSDVTEFNGNTFNAIFEQYSYVDVTFNYKYYEYNTERQVAVKDAEGNNLDSNGDITTNPANYAYETKNYYQYDPDYVGPENINDTNFNKVPDSFNTDFKKTGVTTHILKTKTVSDVEVRGCVEESVTASNLLNAAAKALRHMPENNYYNYKLKVGGIKIDEESRANATSSPDYNYKITAEIQLEHSPRVYSVVLNGTRNTGGHATKLVNNATESGYYYYQEYAELAAPGNADCKWYTSNDDGSAKYIMLATGSTYKFRVNADTKLKTESGVTDNDKKNRSVIDYASREIKHKDKQVNNVTVKKEYLVNNFYISDYFDVDKVLDPNSDQNNTGTLLPYDDVTFVGGGVMYYSRTDNEVNQNVINAGYANADGTANKDTLKQVIKSKIEAEIENVPAAIEGDDQRKAIAYGTEIKPTVEKISGQSTGLVYRYLPYRTYDRDNSNNLVMRDGNYTLETTTKDNTYRYSNAAKSYQYIYASESENSATNNGKDMIVYSYYIYSYTKYDNDTGVPYTVYDVEISDDKAEASTYWDYTATATTD